MKMRTVFLASALVFCSGCGSDDGDASHRVNGVPMGGTSGAPSNSIARGGDAPGGSSANIVSGGIAGSSASLTRDQGGSWGVSSTSQGSGGRSEMQSAGGTSSTVAAGGTAGSSGSAVSGCPVWPRNKLLPTVGPQFYGPDPGPCSRTTTAANGVVTATAFGYVEQAIAYVSVGSKRTNYTRTDGIITGYNAEALTGVVDWDANSVTTTASNGSVVKLVLRADGYPIEIWVSPAAGVPLSRAVLYEYSECRLARQVPLTADGTEDSLTTREFVYDFAGHIVSERDEAGTVVEYNYGCW
jgi:hypothetical protein